jgi:hypothetical protein
MPSKTWPIFTLYYLNIICLAIMMSLHVLSFLGIGIFDGIIWMVLALIGLFLFLVGSSRQLRCLDRHLYGEAPRRVWLNYGRSFYTGYEALWRYRATAHITMPLAPTWAVNLVRWILLLWIPYTVLQAALLFLISTTGFKVILARLAVPWLLPLFSYSLPVLYSWKREH